MIAKTITVNQQTRNKQITTPKGRTRRTIPMTSCVTSTARTRPTTRPTRRSNGSAPRPGCRSATWHTLWHTFGTHGALFGVNPWRLQAWLGHKRIDETMLYVHAAEAHHRELPEIVREKARGIDDPDPRVLAMLGARGCLDSNEVRGSGVALSATSTSESSTKSAA